MKTKKKSWWIYWNILGADDLYNWLHRKDNPVKQLGDRFIPQGGVEL